MQDARVSNALRASRPGRVDYRLMLRHAFTDFAAGNQQDTARTFQCRRERLRLIVVGLTKVHAETGEILGFFRITTDRNDTVCIDFPKQGINDELAELTGRTGDYIHLKTPMRWRVQSWRDKVHFGITPAFDSR